jgi:hypothetical protein
MVLQERRINKDSRIGEIDATIRILSDGQTYRIFGAWTGNNIQYITPWPSVVEKITNDLERWNATNPTLEGKRHIINMVIAGRTQYLTRVQGIPKDIEISLFQMEQTFLWEGKKARIAHGTMTTSVTDGGK